MARPTAAATFPESGWTLSEVRARGFIVFRDGVYDIAPFVHRHPGGDFLSALRGTDATLALENAHGKSRAMEKMLARFYVGPFDVSTRDPFDADVLALREEFLARGLFRYGRRAIVLDIARWALLLACAAMALRASVTVAFVFLLAATVDVVWWIHDAGHDAVFDDERTARGVIEALGIAVLGMPQQGYHYGVHRVHHAFPNVIDVDRALETGTLSWDADTAAKKPSVFRHGRLLQWFLLIVPLAGPALLWSAIHHLVVKKQRALLAAVIARWTLVVAVSIAIHAPILVVAPWVAGSILAFMAGLNHFHLPMSTVAPLSYARGVLERTQNVRAGRFWRWLSGGLDLHIEHHLFATMPSRHYPLISREVRALARRHGLPYHEASRTGAVMNLVRTLLHPLADAHAEEVSGIRRRA